MKPLRRKKKAVTMSTYHKTIFVESRFDSMAIDNLHAKAMQEDAKRSADVASRPPVKSAVDVDVPWMHEGRHRFEHKPNLFLQPLWEGSLCAYGCKEPLNGQRLK